MNGAFTRSWLFLLFAASLYAQTEGIAARRSSACRPRT
jgi:hypothetical protein